MRISDWSSDVCSSDLPGDRRKSKGNARHPFVIGLAVIAVDKIGRDDFCIMAGNRSEWGSVRGSFSGRVDGWTAHALQKFVELQLSVFDCDTALLEIEPLDGGSSSSPMDAEHGRSDRRRVGTEGDRRC